MSGDLWLEVDCPACGIDQDFDPLPSVGDEVRCSCGHVFSTSELAKGNVVESMPEVGRVFIHRNLWRESIEGVPRGTK